MGDIVSAWDYRQGYGKDALITKNQFQLDSRPQLLSQTISIYPIGGSFFNLNIPHKKLKYECLEFEY